MIHFALLLFPFIFNSSPVPTPAVTSQVALGAQLIHVGLVHMSWMTDTIPFSEPSLTAFSTSICFHGSCSFWRASSHLCIARGSYPAWGPLHRQWPGKAHMPETRDIHTSDDLTVGAPPLLS